MPKSHIMKNTFIYLSLFITMLALNLLYAQDTEVDKLAEQKELIIQEERNLLKQKVESINSRLEDNEISLEQANILKQQEAEKHALNIENRIAILENEFALSERNKEEGDFENETGYISVMGEGNIVKFNFKKKRKYDRRTTDDFVFAFGLNNVVTEGDGFEDSDFKIGGSRFAEIGWAWKTRVFKNTNFLRVKYGFSFQFNGLKPTDNRIFVREGAETVLETFPLELNKSKLRMDNLVFPVHFEFGPSKKTETEESIRYSTGKSIKIGLGGYAGFNLNTIQKLKYNDGNKVKEKSRNNFNTNDFVYGLSGYIGWRTVGLYAKYDLNTIFKDNPLAQRNVSLGLRWDMD